MWVILLLFMSQVGSEASIENVEIQKDASGHAVNFIQPDECQRNLSKFDRVLPIAADGRAQWAVPVCVQVWPRNPVSPSVDVQSKIPQSWIVPPLRIEK